MIVKHKGRFSDLSNSAKKRFRGGQTRINDDGTFAIVYLSKRRAYKVVETQRCPLYLKMIMAMHKSKRKNPWFPVIYRIDIWKDQTVIRMERLEKVHWNRYYKIEAAISPFWNPNPGKNKNWQKAYDAMPYKEKFFAAVKLIKKSTGKAQANWDMHDENIMYRKSDGAFVLTDPVYG